MRLNFTAIALLLSMGVFAQSSLVLHYPINHNTISNVQNVMYDQSPFGNDANISGDIFYDDDSFGGQDEAIMTGYYSASHRYFSVDSPLNFGGIINDFTFTFWALHMGAYQQTGIADMFYFKNDDGDEIYIGLDKENYFMTLQIIQDGELLYDNSNAAEIHPSFWQHVAISYDYEAKNLKIYQNGSVISETPLDIQFPANPTLEVAVKDGVPMDGMVICYDEIRLYNQYLTAEDIAIVLQNSTNIGGWTENTEIAIFPNPARSGDLVRISTINNAKANILNARGQLIKSTALNNGELDLAGLASGTYFVQLFNNEQRIVKKLLIQP